MNTARRQSPVDPKLMERIRADQDADLVVYEHARRLAARRSHAGGVSAC
jgi:hypothetical protein